MAPYGQPRDGFLAMSKSTQTASRSSSSMSAQRLARVLVIEDDDLSLDIATRWLRRQGYANVEGAVDGASGLESCLADPPDILILDHSLPIVSGLAIAEHLCISYKREERPWIVLFTAAADSTIQRLNETGYFDDTLRKPCISQDYIDCMTRAHAGIRERRRVVENAWLAAAAVGLRLVRGA
jgi:CheY-like chemotaxis protein